MSREIKVAILGAGNGGLSMAGDLILNGHNVTGIFDRFAQAIEPVKERGGIEMVGEVMSGFAPLENATTDLAQAIDGAHVIVLVVPTFAHDWFAEQLAPLLIDGQIVLLTPGYPGGSLAFKKVLDENGLKAQIDLAETNLILYSTRIVGPAQVGIKGIKNKLFISALPASRTDYVMEILGPLIPQLTPMNNILEVGFHCSNPYSHVPTAILNWGRVETDTGEEHFDWHDWQTPDIKRIGELMEGELHYFMDKVGVHRLSPEEIEDAMYGGKKWKIAPVVGEIPQGSRTIPPRYITEDIPIGLVSVTSLASLANVSLPMHDIFIDLANLIKETNYRESGRTVTRMGIENRSFDELLEIVNA